MTINVGGLRRSVALGGLCALLFGACGGDDAPDPAAIVAPTTSIAPGEDHQFAVETEESVLWGLSETVPPAPVSAATFPLHVSDDGRYLVGANDVPWRVQAEAAWLISSEATPEQLEQYLTRRKAQGFNSFYLMAVVHPGGYPQAPHSPNNLDGDPPFATPNDFSTAGATPQSERYWAWIDSIVQKAADQDMVVMLAYTYLGFAGGDQGWWNAVNEQASRQVLHDWGVWLGNRYKDDPNIIWFGLGDYTPPAGSEGALRVRAIAEGIKEAGATQPFMAEPSPPDELPGEVADFGDLVDMNSFYGYGPDALGAVYLTADRAWRHDPAKPAWMQEGTYENENNFGHFSGEPWDTRRGRFWSVLAGGTAGDGFGSQKVWHWEDLPESLESPGAAYSTYAFELFASMPWWELVPSGTDPGFAGRDLVTAGAGTWGELDYVTSAVTSDGTWLLAYVPVTGEGARTITIDMTALSAPVRARWFDPATGAYLAIPDGDAVPNEGTRDFTTPGSRGDDTDDWLLVLDSSGSAPCGTIAADGTYTAPTTTAAGVTCAVTATLASDPGVVTRSSLTVAD